MIKHLSIRVPWHDQRWQGAVCESPSANPYCMMLDRIRQARTDAEDEIANVPWWRLDPDQQPPCKQENGAFMSPEPWTRRFRHPYSNISSCRQTHGGLRPTDHRIPEQAALAVPYWWMLRETQDEIEAGARESLPPDEEAPFNTSWVFGRARQEALLERFFSPIRPNESLVFFYTKEGHPLGEDIPRLIVGIGLVSSCGDMLRYKSDGGENYPLWERVIRHSISMDGVEGVLLPYHDYLAPTGDEEEDARRIELLKEIRVVPGEGQMRPFSFAAEQVSHDAALSVLGQCLRAVRRVREHGISPGPWAEREQWLNAQLARVWRDRGAFPGFGSALEAMGFELGTTLHHDMLASEILGPEDDPWQVFDALVQGEVSLPNQQYGQELAEVSNTWTRLGEPRKAVLNLLSRFDLSPRQARDWYNQSRRKQRAGRAITDISLLKNPYLIAERDGGDEKEGPITFETIDRGIYSNEYLRVQFPLPAKQVFNTQSDRRRLRAAVVKTLRGAADDGDSLLSESEVFKRLEADVTDSTVTLPPDYFDTEAETLSGIIEIHQEQRAPVDVEQSDWDGEYTERRFVQLSQYAETERWLAKILQARAAREEPALNVDWRELVRQAIDERERRYDPDNPWHRAALDEQGTALDQLHRRRLTVLVGRAGTGKTSVLGGLVRCGEIKSAGILFLAPTGKATVRLGQAANVEARTVAGFLHDLNRYDGVRQRPLLEGDETYRGARTVVIDECSMLTLTDLEAVLRAIDLKHVRRIILVGDPNQLPPIGVGRPFADLVGFLDEAADAEDPEKSKLSAALVRLTVEVRVAETSEPSDTLRLASWFTREEPEADADLVLSRVAADGALNDLQISFWNTQRDLKESLLRHLTQTCGMSGTDDVTGFNRALGIDDGLVDFDHPDSCEAIQILTPVRKQPHGAHELNRLVQETYRRKELERGRGPGGTALGDEEIVRLDKVIQTQNQRRKYRDADGQYDKEFIANGEIGLVYSANEGNADLVFSRRANLSFRYTTRDFPGGRGPLDLAYALTIHKAQGSEFDTTFVIIPRNTRLLSRELIYTALTRSRRRLVLLVEGDDLGFMQELSRPARSNTIRRNTGLFTFAVRYSLDELPWGSHLIHRAEGGTMVRSKSELAIANHLFDQGIPYKYEWPYIGELEEGRVLPDFSFETPDGDTIIWEHLGLLHKPGYREAWERKKKWYEMNGFVVGETLFMTRDDDLGGLDMVQVVEVANDIREKI